MLTSRVGYGLLRTRGPLGETRPRPRRRCGRDRNVDHVCLVVSPVDLGAVASSGRFDVVEGPAPRWGARGMATSRYVRDPDGNVVELRHYG